MRAISTASIGAKSASNVDRSIFPRPRKETHQQSLSTRSLSPPSRKVHGRGERMKAVPVFASIRTGESVQGSRGWFPSVLEEAKIVGYTWHCNRHTFASRLVMAGVDLLTVAELLGHRTLQMVMRCSDLDPEHQSSDFDRLVKAGSRRDTTSDTKRSAAKTIKRNGS
jgi:hypothetical protein